MLPALALVALVGGMTWFGHFERLVFAAITVPFVIVSAAVLIYAVLIYGFSAEPHTVGTVRDNPGQDAAGCPDQVSSCEEVPHGRRARS